MTMSNAMLQQADCLLQHVLTDLFNWWDPGYKRSGKCVRIVRASY